MRLKSGLFLLLASGSAIAFPGPTYQGQGASLGFAQAANIPGMHSNPAAGYLGLAKGKNFRSGFLSIINFSVEAGPVDGFIDRIEDLESCLEDIVEDVCADSFGNVIRAIGDTSIDLDEAEALKAEFDELLSEIGRDAYFIFGAQFQLPSMPMLFRVGRGVIGLDINGAGLANVQVLDDPLRYNPLTEDIETKTAAYLKTARFFNAGISFSRPVDIPLEKMIPGLYTRGKYYLGARLNLMQGTLAKVIAAVDSEDENGDTAFDRVEDSYELTEESSFNVGIDLGLMWVHKEFSAGVSLRNINAPTFKYGTIGENCEQFTTAGQQQDCLIAASFANRADLSEEFTLNPQATVTGSAPLGAEGLQLSMSFDLNAANSPVGDEYQWFAMGLSYAPNSWVIPGVRIGYRSNMADGGVSSIGAGLTLFGVLNLDGAMSTDSVEIDGSEIPRSASVSLSFEMPL